MKHHLKVVAVPLLFLITYSSLNLVWEIFSLPPVDELTDIVGGWFNTFGFPALFICSLLEGLLLIGSYFPGVFVIFIGVLSANSPSEAVLAVMVSTFGLLIAHTINYFLGKYGWYKILVKFGMQSAIEQSKAKLQKRGVLAIPLSYWSPSIGALTNTAAGIIEMPFKKFLLFSIMSSIFWYSLVGIMVYRIGDKALELAGGGSGNKYMFIVIGFWIVVLLIWDYIKRRKPFSSSIVH